MSHLCPVCEVIGRLCSPMVGTIDCAKATFADCSAYSLVVAPDSFTVGSEVPEPSTWALLLIGFAGLGFAGCRKAKSRRTACSAS